MLDEEKELEVLKGEEVVVRMGRGTKNDGTRTC
jgi:hypothetical protein